MPQPKTVKVTVYSARNLKPKKGNGDPLSWVVFGFGKQKCCTDQIRDRNAKWNEESTFTISDSKYPLKLSVKDGNDAIGTVVIPLAEIPSEEHFLKWIPIGPHRKFPSQPGELCLDCWVDEFYEESENYRLRETEHKSKKVKKLKQKLLGKDPSPNLSAIMNRKLLGIVNPKGSVSCEDLSMKKKRQEAVRSSSSASRNYPTDGTDATDGAGRGSLSSESGDASDVEKTERSPKNASPKFQQMRKAVSSLTLTSSSTEVPRRYSSYDDFRPAANGSALSGSGVLPVINEQHYPPKILGCVPNSGPSSGGTLIQVSGRNLGVSKDDIIRLMVAGCNCLSSLEYYTSNKIMCTTGDSEGIGPISMTTKSGGTSSSKIMFEFIRSSDSDQVFHENTETDSGRNSMGNSDFADRERDELIDDLKSQLEHSKTENKELRDYVDKLIVYLLEKYPEALESSKMYAR